MSAYEECKQEIYRIGWRVQYKARKIHSREFSLFDNQPVDYNFTAHSDSKICVEELLNTLPVHGKTILCKLYLQGMTEHEVAQELQISQQAVNKCKKKMLRSLSQITNS